MIKVLIFLLIFLLEQSALCNGSFRIDRAIPEPLLDKSVETPRKDTHISTDGKKHQQDSILTSGTTTSEVNKTDNITSKQTDVNRTAYTTGTRKEVSV